MDKQMFEFWKNQKVSQRVYKYLESEIKKLEDSILRAGKQSDKDLINYLLGYRQSLEDILNYDPTEELDNEQESHRTPW